MPLYFQIFLGGVRASDQFKNKFIKRKIEEGKRRKRRKNQYLNMFLKMFSICNYR